MDMNKHILVTEDTHQALKILAARRGVSVKEVVSQVLEDYLKRKK